MVARGNIPLAEFPLDQPEIHSKAMKFLSKIDPSSPHSVMEQNNLIFTAYSESDGITFICCCDKNVETKDVGLFLNNLKSQWIQAYGASSSTIQANEKNDEFGVPIKELLSHFNEKSIQKKNTPVQPIETLPKPVEHDDPDEVPIINSNPFPLQENSPPEIPDDFQTDESLTTLRIKVFWRNHKTLIIIFCLVLLLLVTILLLVK
ncbi:vesicle-associated membrane protein 7 [Histomonas meleagridis]|uniref:vesicle-associated membrane protein 7 n=1 Tax=Histomonas meleagridis TaxID=135588 RepID=UPI003559A0BF|nr:vesicle-associated membrane protein 7 [Histomonas meleagridis]KAH0802488.1 vesicle-associated membrane protein 7 [Histomonas meleagridis]